MLEPKVYDFPESMSFTIMFYNMKLCHVKVLNREVQVDAYPVLYRKGYIDILSLTKPENQNYKNIIRWLMSRTIPETISRWTEMYNRIGLYEYKPYKAIQMYHGIFNLDGTWILFDDDWCGAGFRAPMYCDEQGCELIEV